jgi:glycosyltransferase involved in cell wall biosynthesis
MSLRLALVTRRYWPLVGGAEIGMANLAGELRRQGVGVTVVTAQWEPHWPVQLVHRGVPVVRLPNPSLRVWGTLRYMFALRRWLKDHRGQLDGVIVSMLKHDAYCAVRTLADGGVPVVLRAEGGGETGDVHWQRTANFGRRIERVCKQAQAIVTTSDAIADELRQAGYAPQRIVRIDYGVAIPPPRSRQRQAAARAALVAANHDLETEEGAPVVAFTGRLHPRKGLADLVRAWPPIAERRPPARLWIVGEGPQREELFELISSLGYKYRICLPGAFDDVGEVLAAADVFVLPSYEEGMSLALLEAMATGLAVVVTDIPGNRALVRDGETGLIVPVQNPRALSRAIERLLSDEPLRQALGAAARQFVVERFSLEKMAREHLELIERLRRQGQRG